MDMKRGRAGLTCLGTVHFGIGHHVCAVSSCVADADRELDPREEGLVYRKVLDGCTCRIFDINGQQGRSRASQPSDQRRSEQRHDAQSSTADSQACTEESLGL